MRAKILASVALFVFSTSLLAAPNGDFVDLVKRWSPTVVDVAAKGAAQAQGKRAPNLPKNHPFRKFFDEQPKKKRNTQSLGSGFIVDPKGIIITNHHVIKGATEITINLWDGRKLPAKLIGSDQYSDVAVLQIISKTPLRLPFVKWGDPKAVEVGQWVFAIGTPFGLRGTVTAGIVSAVNRDINAGQYDDFIQTDAAINRGNSGGPLFNTRGEVIGINTIIVSPSGGSAGAGFAIPVSTALPVIEQLLATGGTSRGWLGVQIQPITKDLASAMGLSNMKGALVAEVLPGSPSEKAGLKQGDVIIKFNGKEVKKVRDLPRLVAKAKVDTLASVEVIRNGRKRTFQVLLGQLEKALAKQNKKQPKKSSSAKAKYGIALRALTAQERRTKFIPPEIKGVLVAGVDRNSPIAESGLRAGSVILEINRRQVRSPKDVYRLLDAVKKSGKKSVLALVWVKGQRTYIALSIA